MGHSNWFLIFGEGLGLVSLEEIMQKCIGVRQLLCVWMKCIHLCRHNYYLFQTLGNVWLKWLIKMWSVNVNKISWKCISVFGKKANLGKSLQVCWSLPKWEKPQQSSRMNTIFNWYISKDTKQDITTEPQFKLHKLEQVAKQLHNKNKNQH